MKTLLFFLLNLSVPVLGEIKKTYEVVAVDHYLHGPLWDNYTVSAFRSHLGAASQKISVSVFPWKGPEAEPSFLMQKIRGINPDLIFLPERLITKQLANKIYSRETPVKIVFVGLGKPVSLLEIPESDQAGVFPQYDIEFLLKQVNRMRKIGETLVVGGIYSKEEAAFIEPFARKHGEFEYVQVKNWKKYMDIAPRSLTFDVTFFLPPRDIKDRNGLPVTDFQFQRLLDFAGLTASYNFLNGTRNAISIGIDGESVGKYAADLAYRFFKGESPGHVSFTDRTLRVHEKSLKNQNLKIPQSVLNLVPKEQWPKKGSKDGD